MVDPLFYDDISHVLLSRDADVVSRGVITRWRWCSGSRSVDVGRYVAPRVRCLQVVEDAEQCCRHEAERGARDGGAIRVERNSVAQVSVAAEPLKRERRA